MITTQDINRQEPHGVLEPGENDIYTRSLKFCHSEDSIPKSDTQWVTAPVFQSHFTFPGSQPAVRLPMSS